MLNEKIGLESFPASSRTKVKITDRKLKDPILSVLYTVCYLKCLIFGFNTSYTTPYPSDMHASARWDSFFPYCNV